tara:strand:+ start:463 stop:645 length:183 start_codon:yes stop_codon:yes gene_type:complete
MKTVLEKKITSTKVYQVRTLPIRKGSDYKYRLFVDGHSKTLYKDLVEAEKHIETLSKLKG